MFASQTPRQQSFLVSVSAAAEHLNVSQQTIRRRIKDGTLPAYRVGRLLKINPADLDHLARPIASGAGGQR